jgi:putative PIN family toxin of toxin-antitoxin system
MKVIFDNNVLISAALLKYSVPFRAFEKAVNNHILLRSHKILLEFENTIFKHKLDRYFKDNLAQEGFIISFIASSINNEPTHRIDVCRDPNDNMYLELAMSGKADAIITGDADLLTLNPFCNIPIITPKYFLENY